MPFKIGTLREARILTGDKLISVFSFYRDELKKKGVPKKQLERYDIYSAGIFRKNHLSHLIYMCDTAIGFVHEGRIEKAMRWLGFIQGVLYFADEYTLDDLKNHSRPDVEPTS